jgi:hypothetical protein
VVAGITFAFGILLRGYGAGDMIEAKGDNLRKPLARVYPGNAFVSGA